MAEHSTVNRRVTGSSPVGGAKLKASERSSEAFPFSRRDSNAVTTALGAGAGAPTPNFVWSSPVGGANIARAPERSSGVLAIYVPLARTSNPSGLRPRRDNGFYFLARSEKPSPRCVESRATGICRRKQRFLVPRALGKSSPR